MCEFQSLKILLSILMQESPKETTKVAKDLTEDKELQTKENLCDTTVEANEKIKTGLSNDEVKYTIGLPHHIFFLQLSIY